MVYRQSIKQEMAKDSTYDGQPEVGSKKLIIRPSSSRAGAQVGRRKFDKDTDNNNNDDDVDNTNDSCDGSRLLSSVVSKKLIIKPSTSSVGAEVVGRKCDDAIDIEDSDSCELPACVSDLKDVTQNTECYGSKTAPSTEVVIETDEQIAAGSMTKKGRKPGKKSAAATGRKGIYECYSLSVECM